MKFLHLGDLHLGKSLGEYDLIPDQKFILDRIIDIAEERDADAVLIAGDVYDKAIPSEAAVNLLDDFLCRLAALKIETFVISGNHDSDDRLNFGSSLFEAGGIHIASVFTGQLYKKTLKDAYGDIHFYLLPFVKASQVRHFFPEKQIMTYEDAVRAVIEAAGVDPAQRNVLAAHQFVTGSSADAAPGAVQGAAVLYEAADAGALGADPELAGSEGLAVRQVGLVEKIGWDCFDDFDYAALGHIHTGQSVGRETVRYAGSPLKYSLSEVRSAKSVPLVTMGEKGQIEIEKIPLKPLRDLRHIKGPIRFLLDKKHVEAPGDFMYVTLTDEEITNDAMGIVRQIYPNTVKLDYENSHTRAIETADLTPVTEQRSFEELIGDFYRLIYQCEISEDEMKAMKQAAKEAGVTGETD